MDFQVFLVFLIPVLDLANCYNEYNTGFSGNYLENHKYCDDLSPYFGDINLDQIAGLWYGVEIIPHTTHERGEYYTQKYYKCFQIDIKEQHGQGMHHNPYHTYGSYDSSMYRTNSPYQSNSGYMSTYSPYPNNNRAFGQPEPYYMRQFVLSWNEGFTHEDYHVKVNTSQKGFWPTDVPSGTVDNMYRFFGGVIQVLRAADTYLVLNFCMKLPEPKHFSVVLSRSENQLYPEDLTNIHAIFSTKRLSTVGLQRVCGNGAANIGVSIFLMFVPCLSWLRL